MYLFFGFRSLADIDQLVVPGIQRIDFIRTVPEQIRDYATGHRRNIFWRIGA